MPAFVDFVALISMAHLGLDNYYLKLMESHGDGTVSGYVVVPHPTDGWVPVYAEDGDLVTSWAWSHQIIMRDCCPEESARLHPQLVDHRSRTERRQERRELIAAGEARLAARQAAESQPSPYADPFELQFSDPREDV